MPPPQHNPGKVRCQNGALWTKIPHSVYQHQQDENIQPSPASNPTKMFGGRKFFPNDSTGCLLMVLQHHPQWARPTWRLLRLRRPWLSRKSLLELLCCTCVCVQSVVRSADAGESYADPWRHSAVCDRCCHEACVGGKTNYDGSICTTKGTVYYGRSRIAYWSIASQRDNDRLNDIGRARHLYNMENEIPLDSVPIHLVVKLRYKGLRSMIGHWSFHSYLILCVKCVRMKEYKL